jgi:hypothetical protein
MRTLNPAIEEAINRVSPRNLYGEPVFRAGWSRDRLHWACGWWNDFDSSTGALLRRVFEPRQCPKYHFTPRWIIEKWHAPEFYGSPKMWDEITSSWSAAHGKTLELGPYPSRGDYELAWICQNLDESFLPLTTAIAVRYIELALQPPMSPAALREIERRRVEQEHEELVEEVAGICDLPFHGRPNNLSPLSIHQLVRQDNKERTE